MQAHYEQMRTTDSVLFYNDTQLHKSQIKYFTSQKYSFKGNQIILKK